VKRTLLSVKELAVELGISEPSVRRAYLTGQLPGTRICRMIRFDLQRVLNALHERGLSRAVQTGAVRIGESRPHGRRPTKRPRTVTRGRG
jgi:hypothetical protein